MEFEWDEDKNEENIRKHGLGFADGEELFLGNQPFLVAADLEHADDEERWHGIGMTQGRVVVSVFVERAPDVIRFISLRKASQQERKAYEEAIEDELESG